MTSGAAGDAVVEGRVVGPLGEPMARVEVRLQGDARPAAPRSLTDVRGAFRLEGVPAPGSHRLVCSVGGIVELGPLVELREAGEVATAEVVLRLRLSDQVSVVADAWTLPSDLPNTTAGRSAEQLRTQNVFNPEDALQYVPNTTIRKRYIGDRNALLGGRSFGTLQPSRGLVYLEGYLLSNFLGRFDAPRWNMVTPEALERVDVLYGPFSAIHAGNSIGTTVVMTERVPRRLEWGASLTGYGQRFSQYGDRDDYRGGQFSSYVGTCFASGLWGVLTYNHQDSRSQPMQYFTISANPAGQFPAVAGPAVQVAGIRYDVDPKGNRRAVFGPNAGAIDHSVQDSLKLRAGYAITPELEASALVAGWINSSDTSDRTFLRDANGREVWQGRVTDGTYAFNIPATAFAPAQRDEKHRQLGATLRTRRPSGWNGALIGSDYRILEDPARQANNPDPVAALGGAGTVTRRDGMGWNTLEAQATHGSGGGRHALTFGVHRNAYSLTNVVRNAADWRDGETTLSQRYRGRTQVVALYAQDAFRLREDVKLTLGWRAEWYRTTEGEQLASVASCTAGGSAACQARPDGAFDKTVAYPKRALAGQSPKASLSWSVSERQLLRASFGRGVRFPNVEELYNGTVTATSVTLSDPGLKAERSNAFEMTSETSWSQETLRVSLFHDDVQDAILRQSDTTVTPSITNVSNADRVRTSGLELAFTAQQLGLPGLTLEASGALTRSKVTQNAKDPASVGKYWLRVPRTRANLLVAYRPNAKWLASAGFRHQGRAYNDVYNLDVNPDVYGGVSSVDQLDLRVAHEPRPGLTIALGMDNVGDQHAYQSHPYPGRTLFVQLRTSSR